MSCRCVWARETLADRSPARRSHGAWVLVVAAALGLGSPPGAGAGSPGDNAGRVALERRPIVYCAEGVDNGGQVFSLVLPDDAPLEARHQDGLLGGLTVIEGQALALSPAEDGRSVVTRAQDFVAVPYYAWAHRGEGEMAVWLPRRVRLDFRIP